MTFRGETGRGGSCVSDKLHDANSFIKKRAPVVGGRSVYAEAAQTVTPDLSMWASGDYWGGLKALDTALHTNVEAAERHLCTHIKNVIQMK